MNKYERLARESREEVKHIIRCQRKRQFQTEEEAASCNPQQKPYLCNDCGHWHLSGAHLRDNRGFNLPKAKGKK